MANRAIPFEYASDLLAHLGGIPASRVRLCPTPGTATKRDLRAVRLCELIDGTLVEKPRGTPKAYLGAELAGQLGRYLVGNDLGYLCGPGALVELLPGSVRAPDICLTRWADCPGGLVPQKQIADIIPVFVVDILSPSNTRKEIARKLKEYFLAGVELAWVIDPKTKSATAYTAPDVKTAIPPTGTLTGDPVLPGFALPLATLFAKLAPATKGKKK